MTRAGNDGGLAPARRNRARTGSAADTGPSADAVGAEVARGQSDAVLGAMARVQIKLDLLAREQSDVLADVIARLSALEAAMSANDRSQK